MDSSRIHINIIRKRSFQYLFRVNLVLNMSNLYKNTVELQLMATSLQRPPLYMRRLLSSVAKVVAVERFNCIQLSNYLWCSALLYSETSIKRTPIKQTPSFKQTLSQIPKLTSYISLYNEPLFSGHLY